MSRLWNVAVSSNAETAKQIPLISYEVMLTDSFNSFFNPR
jgi:hypothetical protein